MESQMLGLATRGTRVLSWASIILGAGWGRGVCEVKATGVAGVMVSSTSPCAFSSVVKKECSSMVIVLLVRLMLVGSAFPFWVPRVRKSTFTYPALPVILHGSGGVVKPF